MNNKTTYVHILDRDSEIAETITLYDLISTGDSYTIGLVNYGKIGSEDFELIVYNQPNLLTKVEIARKKRAHESK